MTAAMARAQREIELLSEYRTRLIADKWAKSISIGGPNGIGTRKPIFRMTSPRRFRNPRMFGSNFVEKRVLNTMVG